MIHIPKYLYDFAAANLLFLQHSKYFTHKNGKFNTSSKIFDFTAL